MDPSTCLESAWWIIHYYLEGQVPPQTVFGSIQGGAPVRQLS